MELEEKASGTNNEFIYVTKFNKRASVKFDMGDDTMLRVKLVKAEDGNNKVNEVFEDIRINFGMIPNLFKAYALRPEILEATWNRVKAVMVAGELPRQLKEMIAVVVSKVNGCQYCINAHSAALKMMGVPQQQARQLVDNFETADLPEDVKMVLRLAVKSTKSPDMITDLEIEELRKLGFSDANIIEIFSVVDLFTSFNRFLDTLSVPIDFPAP